jgi:hypothetical protein
MVLGLPSDRDPALRELITSVEGGTLPGLLFERIRRTPEAVAYLEYDAKQRNWS